MESHSLLQKLSQEDRSRLLSLSRKIRAQRTAKLYDTGTCHEPAIVFVAEGLLEIRTEERVTGFLGRDDAYLSPLLSDLRSGAPEQLVVASQAGGVFYLTPAPAVWALAAQSPAWFRQLLEYSLRADATRRVHLATVKGASPSVAVARALHQVAQVAQPNAAHPSLEPIAQSSIASFVGITRETVSRVLRELQASGVVKRDRDGYSLQQPSSNSFDGL